MTFSNSPLWRVPAGQRLITEDFDDGIVVFDALVGSTHLLNVTAAEALAIVEESPASSARSIHRQLLERLEIDERALPFASVEELLWRLEDLSLVEAVAP